MSIAVVGVVSAWRIQMLANQTERRKGKKVGEMLLFMHTALVPQGRNRLTAPKHICSIRVHNQSAKGVITDRMQSDLHPLSPKS